MTTQAAQRKSYERMTKAQLVDALLAQDQTGSDCSGLTSAFDNASEGISVYDADRRLVFCNKEFMKLYNYSDSDVADNPKLSNLLKLDVERETVRLGEGGRTATHNREAMFDDQTETVDLPLADGRWIQIRDRHTPDGGFISIHTDITDHILAECELAQKEAQLRDIVENMTEGMVCYDSEQRLILCNSKYRDYYGYSEDDTAPGTKFGDLVRLDVERGAIIDEGSYQEDWLGYRKQHGKEETLVFQLADGLWLQVREHTGMGGTVSIQTDITERVNSERELAEKEDILRTILENAPGGIRCVDKDARIVALNQEYRDLWNMPNDVSMVGNTLRDELAFMVDRGDYGEGDREEIIESVSHALKFHTESQNYERTTADGKHLEAFTRPLKQGGYVSIYIDITERKRAEQELSDTLNVLQTVLDNVPGGIRCVDKDRRIIAVNQEYRDLWNMPKSVSKVGNTDHQELEFMVERGDYGEGDKEEIIDTIYHALTFDTEPQHYERTTAEGRQLESFTRPLEQGGFVSIYIDITERKRAEEELHAAREQLVDAIESIADGFAIFDSNQRLLICNAKYKELYDYTDDDIPPGVLMSDLYKLDVDRGTVAAYRGVGQALNYDVENYDVSLSDLEFLFTDGRWVRVRDRKTSTGGIVTINSDITKRKRAEEELTKARDKAAAAEALFKDAIDNISDGFVLYDVEDRLVVCNDRFLDFYQYPAEKAAQHPTWTELEVYDTERNIIEWESEGDVPRGERRWDDFQRRLSDGRWIDIRQRLTALGGLACIHVDITAQKQAEEALREARDLAEAAAQMKSDFVAVVSHEVRTPMNGVLGMARLLVDESLTPQQREYAETIVFSGESLLAILNDLLDISKLEAGKLDIEAIPMETRRFVTDTVNVMTPRAREKELDLRYEISNTLPDAVRADPHRLRQILLNLVSNAIKFTDKGEVVVRLNGEKTGKGLRLCLSVTDTGMGIPEKTQEKLFSPYTQGSVEVARKYGGTGLGLAICRRLADLMEGELTLDSAPGKGSSFTLRIPVELASKDEIQDVTLSDSLSPPGETASMPLQVLLVEDNKVNQRVAVAMLEKQGHEVDLAENGAVAVDLFKNKPYDVVLMDRHMPEMDGIEATRLIREMDNDNDPIVIIGVTAAANEAEIADCLDAGMNEVITKPIEPTRMAMALSGIKPHQTDMSPDEKEGEDALPAFDASRVEELVAEYGEDMVSDLAADFRDAAQDIMKDIDKALSEGDQIALRRHAHSLKSSSLTMGFMALSDHCRSVELATIEGEIETAKKMAAELPKRLDEAMRAFSKAGK